jgi:cyclin A
LHPCIYCFFFVFFGRKFEEIYPPEVGEFVYITDDTYKTKQVLRMEHLILKVLSFDVAVPTINVFCEKFAKESGCEDAALSLAMVCFCFLSLSCAVYMFICAIVLGRTVIG